MEKEFIPYEQALDLKQLGFDEPCMAQWNDSNGFDGFGGNYRNSYFNYPDQIAAPLYQQAFRWFREKYGLSHYNIRRDYNISEDGVRSYDDIELECIKKLIEIVKNK